MTRNGPSSTELPARRRRAVEGWTTSPNKRMQLTKPEHMGASQLIRSVGPTPGLRVQGYR